MPSSSGSSGSSTSEEDGDASEATQLESAVGDSSDSEPAAPSAARGFVGLFTWPCPRQYASTLEKRQSKNMLLPADFSKEKLGNIMRRLFASHHVAVQALHVVDEPHKRYSRTTGLRERHKHVVVKAAAPFAHARITKELAAQGVHGMFHFNMIGYSSYVSYLVNPGAKKLQADLDPAPWNFPEMSMDELRKKAVVSPQLAARAQGHGAPKDRKRSLLDFSELTDVFVENSVRTPQAAWAIAKRRKQEGDVCLWNTLGAAKDVASLVDKVLQGWHNENQQDVPFFTMADFPLTSFIVPDAVAEWISHGHEELALVISGPPKKGKTELACAAAARVSELMCDRKQQPGVAGYFFLNELDDIKFVKLKTGQVLVVDECSLRDIPSNTCKAWLDLKKPRRIKCRNFTGTLPQGTARIFITNDSWSQFISLEALKKPHDEEAIKRRCLFHTVTADMRRPPPQAPAAPEILHSPQRAVLPNSNHDDSPLISRSLNSALLMPQSAKSSDHDDSPLVPKPVPAAPSRKGQSASASSSGHVSDDEDYNPFGFSCGLDE